MKTRSIIQSAKTIPIISMLLLAWMSAPLAGQSVGRMWAAQTGPDQVRLSWDHIPGANEYWIYLGAPGGPGTQRPYERLSSNSDGAFLTGIKRLSNGIYLVAVDVNGRVLQQAPFNQVAAATTFSPITPPAQVTAMVTGTTEVALSWNPVPGATAFFIGRAVGNGGYSTICDLCSTQGYVDRDAQPGFPHTYTVSAIFPQGISERITSNRVTPGVTPVATAPVQQLPAMTTGQPTYTPGGMPGGVSGAPGNVTNTFTPGGTPAQVPVMTTVQPTYTPGGMPGGVSGAPGNVTNTFTPGGTPVQVPATTATQPPTVHTATPIANTQTMNTRPSQYSMKCRLCSETWPSPKWYRGVPMLRHLSSNRRRQALPRPRTVRSAGLQVRSVTPAGFRPPLCRPRWVT